MRNARFCLLRPLFIVVALVMGVLSPISLPGIVRADAAVSDSVAAVNAASDAQAMRAALDVFADYPTNSATPYGSLDEGRQSAVATDMLASRPSNGNIVGYTDQTAGEIFGGLVAFRVEVARAVNAANGTPGELTVPMLRDLLATTAALPSGAILNGEALTGPVLSTFGSLLDVNGDRVVADVNLRPENVTYQSFTQMILQGFSGVVFVDPSSTDSGGGSLIAPYPNLDDVRGQLAGKHTIVVGSGSVTLSATLNLNDVSLIGAASALTTINYSEAPGLSNGIQIDGANVTLRGFSLTAAGRTNGAAANYAIKTQPGVVDLLVEDVAVADVQKTAFDVNSVVGAVFRNVTVSGVAAGFGMAIGGARDVLIDGLSVSQAAWGDVGVYPWPETDGQLPENIRFQGELGIRGFTVQSILAGVTVSTTTPTDPGFVDGAHLTVPDAFSSLVSVTCQNGRSDFVVRPEDVSALLALVGACTIHTVADAPTPVRIVRDEQIVGGFSRISEAVAAASSGDRIEVSPGTYNENVSLNKNGLALVGTVFGQATVSGAVTIAADDVTVQGLRISSTGGSGVIVSGIRHSPRIIDNIIEDPTNVATGGQRGVLFSGWTGTAEVSRNNISGFASAAFVDGTIAQGDTILIRENTVFDLDSGNTAFPNDQVGGTALYERNTILGPNVRNGISMLPETSKVMVRGNTIRYVTGIAVSVRGSEVTIVDNDLSENDRAISVRGASDSDAVTTLLVRNNNLSNATTSAVTLESGSPAGVLRAAENFWGAGVTPTVSAGTVGPTVTDLRPATVTDQVVISPWLDAPGGRPVLLAGSVVAVVTDIAGAPLSGVTITLDSAPSAVTGTDGRASFSGVSAGQYTVAIAPGEGRLVVGSVTRTVSVTAESAALVEFTLATLSSISGRVTNTSGDGVSGVTVAITGEQVVVVTGVDGSYVFSGRNPGTAVVSVTPPAGYLAAGRTAALVNLIAGSSAVADFQVIQTGRIAGRVVDSTGVGVAGVPVSLNGAAPVLTGFDGGYAFTGQTPGGYTVTLGALPNGFVATRAQALVNLSAGSSAVADFQVTQTGRIGGRVVDSTGIGVAGVPVSLNGATPVVTGLDGSYAFTGQNPGTYTVTLGALPAGFAAGSATRRDVVVAPGGSASAEFLVVRMGAITGRITDLSGAGISGISVAIGSSSTTTGLDGRYEFAGFNPGIYSVALGALPGSFLAEREITTRTVNLAAGQGARADFRLVELGVVTGRVVDETGAGISGVTVTVNGTPLLSSIDGSYRLGGLVAGSSPAFSVDVPSGFALPTGRGLPTVTVGQTVADVVLLQIGVVAGYAFLDLNGNDQRDPGEPPLAGVIATLTAGGFSATATTSADGFYRFDNVPLSANVAFTAPTGFDQAVDPSISPTGLRLSSRGITLMNGGNSTFVQDVGLLPAGTVLGYVSLAGDPLAGVSITVGGSEQITSQDGVALFRGVTGAQTMSVSVPEGFKLVEGQASRSVTPGSAPLQEFKLRVTAVGEDQVQNPPPSTVIPEVRQVVPVASGPLTSVAVTTAAGRVDFVFTGVASTTGTPPEIVVRPLGYRTLDRGILGAGQRFSITAERFTFAEVEVCLPVAGTAVAATQAAPDRVRLLHTRSDGSEYDVTTTYQPTGSNPRICGTASEFSTFQAVVVASERIAGADRYATAAQVAAETHPNGASLVYIASGDSSADALVAGAAAALANAPLLLVSHGLVPVATVQALEALAPTRVVVVGGTAAISSAVQTRIGSISGATVVRIGGADRYETAALLATDRFPTGVNTVYVVTGQNFPDALAAGAVAGQRNAAVVLVPESGVPESVATALQGLNPDRIIVVGGVTAVSAATFVTLQGSADQVERIGGVDRYDTAARLTLDASPGQPLILVTGQNFPDALVAATLARRRGGAVLMVATESIPGATRTRTAALAPSTLVFVGGPQAMSPTVELRMVRLLNASTPGQW